MGRIFFSFVPPTIYFTLVSLFELHGAAPTKKILEKWPENSNFLGIPEKTQGIFEKKVKVLPTRIGLLVCEKMSKKACLVARPVNFV